ncbi:MAG: SPOR domain-containing protein [Pseudomonadota bacterium]
MIIEAEFNEIEGDDAELDFADGESLPWLEAEEDDAGAGGVDTAQLVGFVVALFAILLVVVGGVWYVSNRDRGPVAVADGSTIEAPDGPYKERPDDPGGKEFAGTDDVAPGVSQGEQPNGRLANSTGAAAGDPDLDIPMPPIEGAGPSAGSRPGSGASSPAAQPQSPSGASTGASTGAGAGAASAATSTNAKGVGVQLAAYSSRARAEKGWRELQRQSKALEGLDHRVLEGRIDIGTVYRLQALAPNRAAADTLCRTLKGQGLDCQVKP